jgi:rubrerythrin
MPLTNFGAIMNFSETLEKKDCDFYLELTKNPACAVHKDIFQQFVEEGKKLIKTSQRVRRENVTEMILESISDFHRADFQEKSEGAANMNLEEALVTAKRLEERAVRFYSEAALKIKAIPEAASALKQLAKKHSKRLKRISDGY